MERWTVLGIFVGDFALSSLFLVAKHSVHPKMSSMATRYPFLKIASKSWVLSSLLGVFLAAPLWAQKPDAAARAYALADAGYKLYDAGQYAAAAKDFEQVLQLEPQNYAIAAQLGYAYLHLNEPDKAKAEFQLATHSSDAKLRASVQSQLQDMEPAQPGAEASAPASSADLADAGYKLYDAGQYAAAAKDFEQVLQHDPKNYDAAAQLGYADLNLHQPKQAEAAFRIALQSPDPKLRAQMLAEIKLLHPASIYFDVYGDLIYLNRFDDFVGDLQTRLAKTLGSSPFSVYWGNDLSRDTNSQNGIYPVIFADNVYMSGVGLLLQPGKAHYSLYAEANVAVNLLKYPLNEYNERSDLRVVASYDNRWEKRWYGPLGALTFLRPRSPRLYTFVDGSAGYYTRYFGDAIAYGQMQEGVYLGNAGDLQFLGYARYNLAADSIHEFYNNLGEFGPGFAIRSRKEHVDVTLETEYIHGVYFGVAAAGQPNPYSPTYNDLRVTLVFGHRF